MWGNIAIAFLLAFIVAFMATPYTIKIAKKVGAVSIEKGKRRMHNRQMPKFGGPAVILGFLVSVGYLLIVMSLEGGINLFGEEQYGKKLLGMLLGIIVLAITCIIDDIKTIKPITKPMIIPKRINNISCNIIIHSSIRIVLKKVFLSNTFYPKIILILKITSKKITIYF